MYRACRANPDSRPRPGPLRSYTPRSIFCAREGSRRRGHLGQRLRLLGGALAHFSDPLPIADSFFTLLLVGLLLAFVRRRTGAIATGIGLHMGWVAVIKVTIATTHLNENANWSFLVGDFDGYTGWLVAGWSAILLAFAWSRGWLALCQDEA